MNGKVKKGFKRFHKLGGLSLILALAFGVGALKGTMNASQVYVWVIEWFFPALLLTDAMERFCKEKRGEGRFGKTRFCRFFSAGGGEFLFAGAMVGFAIEAMVERAGAIIWGVELLFAVGVVILGVVAYRSRNQYTDDWLDYWLS